MDCYPQCKLYWGKFLGKLGKLLYLGKLSKLYLGTLGKIGLKYY